MAAVRGAESPTGADDDKVAVAALRDHWWVEREDNGKWIAMDVLLADASAGDAVTAATSTSEWKAGSDVPSIPAQDWHTVRIRVIVERSQSGATDESTVLEATIRPLDVLERPVSLSHMPIPWPADFPGPKPDLKALREAALAVKEWVPSLRVGRDPIVQSGFTDRGDVRTNPLDPVGSSAGGGGLFGGMDSALGGGDEGSGSATAEWIDYEIRVPGAPDQRVRRPVFDLLGPARRSAKASGFDPNTDALRLERFEALWSRTDILLQPCDFTEEFVAHLTSASIIANRETFKELSQERDPVRASRLGATIVDRVDAWGPLLDLALWRSALARQPSDWLIDRPNVLNYRVGRPVGDAGRAVQREMIDVSANAIGVRRGASSSAFQVRLEQGVADTVAEMLALGSDHRAAENTASIFAMSSAGAGAAVLVRPRDADAVRGLGWPVDTAARLVEDIGAGFMAVALKQPVVLRNRGRLGWWRVDPASGETIGVMDTGFHQVVEDVVRRNLVSMRAFLTRDFAWYVQNVPGAHYYSEYAAMRAMCAQAIRQAAEAGFPLF
jgi:hypothetical protein